MHAICASLTFTNLVQAAGLFAGFVTVLFLGTLFLPGEVVEGVTMPDGRRQSYKMNGFVMYLGACALGMIGTITGKFSLSIVHRLFWPLFVVVNVAAFAATAGHYVVGRRKAAAAGTPLESGPWPVIRDSFMGTEICPTLWGVDLKMFAYRPSLIGLAIINWSFAAAQYEQVGYLTNRMWLFQIFYFLYLANHFQYEHGMLSTWDIIAEKFGWMLIWGDYVLVPFFYSIAGWYLLDTVNMGQLSLLQMLGLAMLFALGWWLFRGSNEQKHRFKEDRNVKIWGKPAETVGGRLLVSGFWGIGRKLNYTGELLMYYAWTLPCGLTSIVPFLLPLWLTGFFPHRAWRDDKRCRAKYGPLWEEYCARAKFRMFPFLY